MYQLVALQAVWIVVIKTADDIVLEVHLGVWTDKWSEPPIQHPIIQLQEGDAVIFRNIMLDDNPYQIMLDQYPALFRLEGDEMLQ